MNELEFEWDAVKAARNEADHGVTFEMARDVFKDPFAIEFLDDREDCGKDRYVTSGCPLAIALLKQPFDWLASNSSTRTAVDRACACVGRHKENSGSDQRNSPLDC